MMSLPPQQQRGEHRLEPRNSLPHGGLAESAVPRRKLSDEVLERLLQQIESGSFKPGDQLPSERELMSAYRVGRPAVREALQSLQRMSMISINHGERARVVSVTPGTMFDQIARSAKHLLSTSPQTLEQLKEARLMFEVAMVRLAAEKATAADLAKLREAVDSLAGARRSDAAFLTADIAFHETIASISGNPIFAAISRAMLEWLAHSHVELVRDPGAEDVTLTEHQHILERVAARDTEGAVKSMTDHLNRSNPRSTQGVGIGAN
jgi:GntR family transcriptional regulator, sialic acid-inducible nan operon repressor